MALRYPLANGGYSYRPLKQGMEGWDVLALQLGLRSVVSKAIKANGSFGGGTLNLVLAFQAAQKLDIDGVAGVDTQRELAKELIWPVQRRFETPPGLIRGLIEAESGYRFGNYTGSYRNGTRDVGLTQENIAISDVNLLSALNGAQAIQRLGKSLRDRKNYAIGKSSYVDTNAEAWKYGAILYHNWQAASNRYIDGTIATWVYTAFDSVAGKYKQYRMSDPAQWIIDIGVAGVSTGYQWVNHYVTTKTVYVKEYTD